MNQYIRNLLALALVANSAWLVIPCKAQTPVKSKSENPNNIIPVSSQSPIAVDTNISNTSSNSTNSTNNKPIASSNPIPATKPNPRIPISSRVFAAPSMEQ
ncbi:hypothetical protein PI95_024695 [Hassallia byssoidea VB512170]|uniref:Uncharacterized protein n=1 Tax=Hassallia byssoidea VB512170 TaxID=1304833 RepID=A0A846HGZ1_9CYAN|nr:hypothetical protein [Hassalia byssoidea]NEU75671.1 hypothetical protein [Hassalia byssoidea VB512170]